RAHHGSRSDGARVFRAASRADRGRRRPQAASVRLPDRLPLPPVGHRPHAGWRSRSAVRRARLCCQAGGGWQSVGGLRDHRREDAGLPRASVPRRGAHARPSRRAPAILFDELLDERTGARHCSPARRHPAAPDVCPALPRSPSRAHQRLCAARADAGALRRLAGPYPRRSASLRDGLDRAGLQGRHHSSCLAAYRRTARHSPRDRDGGRHRPDHAGRHCARRVVDGGHASGHRRCDADRARGSCLCARGRPARPADHDNAAECGRSGDRLHGSRKRFGARGDGCQRHATRRRDQRRLLHPHRLHRHRHFSLSHPRALRHGRSAGARPIPGRAPMNILSFGAEAVLLIPLCAAGVLAALPGYLGPARINVGASFLTLLAASSLLIEAHPAPGRYLLVDDLNVVFLALNAFVGFTTSVFSASYVGHEVETGRLTPAYLRFYHAMYQILMFAMNLALMAYNIGIMWVAIVIATLTTETMVGLYRTHEALEAAWKYFILASVGIALALFGTILVYVAAEPVIGEGLDSMIWT